MRHIIKYIHKLIVELINIWQKCLCSYGNKPKLTKKKLTIIGRLTRILPLHLPYIHPHYKAFVLHVYLLSNQSCLSSTVILH